MSKLNTLQLVEELKQKKIIKRNNVHNDVNIQCIIEQLAIERGYKIIIEDMNKAREQNDLLGEELFIPLFIAKMNEELAEKTEVLVYDLNVMDIMDLNLKYLIMGGIY